MKINKIYSWSTFEDAIPDFIKQKWVRPNQDNYAYFKCPEHNTYFDREEEPCWQCYKPYE